ncbi:MAG: hypothetical protein ACI9XO_001829 [Paraglaciecola sp.]|jgi:hypothetical protein
MKYLFLLLLGYYVYRSFIKPHLSSISKEEEEIFRFEKKTEPEKRSNENDYIDYEEVD